MNIGRVAVGMVMLMTSAFRDILPAEALSEESMRVLGLLLLILGSTETTPSRAKGER